jgi:iron complex outermembrane recepter protein
MRKFVGRRAEVIAVAALGGAVWGISHPAAGAEPAAAEGGDERLQTIIVTATKRAESSRDVAMSLTAVTGATLARLQEVNFADYAQTIPGMVMIASDPGHTQLALRGIETEGTGATVGMYLDEAPYGSSSALANGLVMSPNLDTFDMERIEVLRGPQGTLYGANTLGGLLKFVTRPPDPSAFDDEVQVGIDRVAHSGGTGWSTKAMVNLPLASGLALRVDGYRWTQPGFIDDPAQGRNDVNGSGEKGGRASLLWDRVKGLSVRLTAYAQNLQLNATNGVDVTTVPSSVTASGERVSLTPLYGDLKQGRVATEASTVRYRLYNATVNWDLGWAGLTSSSSYSTFDSPSIEDATALYGTLVRPVLGEHRITQELRLASPSGRKVEWLVGFYYDHENADLHQDLVPTPAAAPLGFVQVSSAYLETAGFANVTYHFSRAFDLNVGGRWAHNDQRALEFGLASAGGDSAENVLTWSVAPRWHITADTMAYIRVAKGYQPGGPNLLPPNPPPTIPATFHSDTLVNYELGVKSQQLNGRLALDADVFDIKWRGIQLLTVVDNFGVNGNGGSADSKGIEGDLSWIPVDGLTLRVGGAYTRARLTSNTDPILVGAVSGEPLPYVPDWSGSAGADYTFYRAGDSSAFAGADWRYTGVRDASFDPALGRTRLPADSEFDLHAGARRGRWQLELYARNITDERGIAELDSGASAVTNAAPVVEVVEPRTIGFTLTGSF